MLAADAEVASFEELLTVLEGTSGVLADTVDVPPLNVPSVRTSWQELRRQVIIRNQDDEKLLEVPLTTGVVVGGAFTLLAPVLAALGAMAALLARVKVEVVRAERKIEGSANSEEQ